ncbi:2-hydroxyhepta-2,4-diene-1,7-dioate isomerase [Archaeoglobales archaeon]|nr:MAG: 2-hydroxyhepta-2,4-diene-1,7-dioate isomerase [Archaeoglobales archaeon]
MKCFGRFVAKGEVFEGYFEIKNNKISFDSYQFNINTVKFLPPVSPTKVICVGLNYKDHAEEFGLPIPDEPILFMKPSTAVIGHKDIIELPSVSKRIDYEGELAVVIAKDCKNVLYEEAENYVLGYTCFNDVTARDLQQKDGQWTRAKSFDTFASLGPYIALDPNPSNLKIETRLNGEVVQKSNTKNLIFDVFRLVEFVSNIMTLKSGDVIATGTPSGVGMLKDGDIVEVEIENIGTLKNKAMAVR